MDIHKILSELYEERQHLDEVIAAMEGLAATGRRRRGRPPKWLAEARKNLGPTRKSQPASNAGKKRRGGSKRDRK